MDFLSGDVLSRLLHYDTIFHRHHMTIFLNRMNSLGFVLLPLSIDNVPLSAEEVNFFGEELTLAIPIYFQAFVILVLVID